MHKFKVGDIIKDIEFGPELSRVVRVLPERDKYGNDLYVQLFNFTYKNFFNHHARNSDYCRLVTNGFAIWTKLNEI